MTRDIDQLSKKTFDMLIIGGGINGAAIANVASLNGLSVALIEKGDFASGTSSKSSKLVHGGLRYLENFEFDLVKEALFERHIQLKSAPHLVKPLGFIFPVYKKDPKPFWTVRLGIALYDFLCGSYLIKKHKVLKSDDLVKIVPEIKTEGLCGGVLYYDAQMDDARLCLENVLSACQQGAAAANYLEARSLIKINGKTVGVEAYDKIGKKSLKIRAKKVVCAAGPWINEFVVKENSQAPLKVRTTKGVHIVYRGQACEHALILPTVSDRRVIFMIPFMGNTLIGTTDTDYEGPSDDVKVEEEDIDYIFKEVSRVFPKSDFSKDNIITSFAGLRPLVYKPGAPSKVSRKHVIEESYSGMIYVMGGKYTTYRKIAEDCLKFITKKKLVDTTDHYPIYGGGSVEINMGEEAVKYGVSEKTLEHLVHTYGSRYADVLAIGLQDKKLLKPIIPDYPAIFAQIVYAKRFEMALLAEDVIWRRLGLGYVSPATDGLAQIITYYLNY